MQRPSGPQEGTAGFCKLVIHALKGPFRLAQVGLQDAGLMSQVLCFKAKLKYF